MLYYVSIYTFNKNNNKLIDRGNEEVPKRNGTIIIVNMHQIISELDGSVDIMNAKIADGTFPFSSESKFTITPT